MLTPELQKQIVQRARTLISKPECWARTALAEDINGATCPWSSCLAVRFCAVGALKRAAMDTLGCDMKAAESAASEVERVRIPTATGLVTVNHMYGHGAVLALFDKALA